MSNTEKSTDGGSAQDDSGTPHSEFTSNIRPLTAEEYRDILETSDCELRVSDGSPEGTWRFWIDHGRLFFRRLSWTQNQTCDTDFMQNVLDGDGTTQLITGGSND